MKRGSALGLGIAAAVVVVVAAALAWLVGTRSGLEFAWRQLAGRLPEGIEVGALDGRLLGPLRATNVVLDAAGMHVEIARLEMRWHPSRLLHRTFDIERLTLSGVEATKRSAPAPAEATAPTLPESVALPLDVEVRAASVEDLRYFSSADAAPVDVDRVELAATLARERWAVRDLAIAAPRFSAAGRVSLVPSGDYATDAELDWTLHWPEHPDARGKTVVAGNLDRLTIGQTVDDPYGLDARLAITKLLSAAELDGRIEARPSPAAIGVAAPVETISATAMVGGSLSAVDVVGRAVLGAGRLGEAAISIDATYAADALDVRSLEVTEPSAHGRLTLAGKVALAPQIDVALAGDWQSLSWPLVGEPVVESPKGSLRLSGAPEALRADLSATVGAKGGVDGMVRRNGDKLDASLAWHDLAWPAEAPEAESESGKIDVEGTVDDYRFTLEAGLALSSGRTEGRLSAAGSGSLEAVDIERIEAEALRGKLSGHAAVQLRPSLRASVALTADGLDPSVLDSALPGRIDARIEADGGLEDEGA
ncbi:MAG TPA: hypothetical protein VFV10_01225, partial [Gammaproteobacteria bacterium]|nr:hypothetical protein [Gammaproteobacteria bacterium]